MVRRKHILNRFAVFPEDRQICFIAGYNRNSVKIIKKGVLPADRPVRAGGQTEKGKYN